MYSSNKVLIREALMELYRDVSLNKVTVKMICDKAYISRSTFYNIYPSVQAVIDELHAQVLEGLHQIFADYRHQNFLDVPEEYASPVFLETLKHSIKWKDFFCGAFSTHGDPVFYKRLYENWYDFLNESIGEAVKEEGKRDFACRVSVDFLFAIAKCVVTNQYDIVPLEFSILAKNSVVMLVRNIDSVIASNEKADN